MCTATSTDTASRDFISVAPGSRKWPYQDCRGRQSSWLSTSRPSPGRSASRLVKTGLGREPSPRSQWPISTALHFVHLRLRRGAHGETFLSGFVPSTVTNVLPFYTANILCECWGTRLTNHQR